MPIHDWTRVQPEIFHDFHHEWISALKRTLNDEILPDDFYALAEQVAGGLGPDLLTLGRLPRVSPKPTNGHEAAVAAGKTCVEVDRHPPTARFVDEVAFRPRRKTSRVAIRHTSDDRVVAFVEVVSPGNKSSARGLRSFVRKAVEFIQAGIHLLVLDLFPPGSRDPQGIHAAIWQGLRGRAFQLPVDAPLTMASYSAGVSSRAYVEPTAVGRDLPDMPLFLEPDEYVTVPLEETYERAFTAVPKHYRDRLTAPE